MCTLKIQIPSGPSECVTWKKANEWSLPFSGAPAEVLQITWENPSAVSNFPYSFIFKFSGILIELIKLTKRKKNDIWIF